MILLINPPFDYGPLKSASSKCPPLGLAYIASYLEKFGYEVKILDAFACEYTIKDIKKKIKKESPSIVGVTTVTANFPVANKILKITKEMDKDIKTILGGPHITLMPHTATKDTDYIVIGEGELTTVELVDYLIKGKRKIHKIKGIGFM